MRYGLQCRILFCAMDMAHKQTEKAVKSSAL
jgi:hypothetical protein